MNLVLEEKGLRSKGLALGASQERPEIGGGEGLELALVGAAVCFAAAFFSLGWRLA